MTDTAESSDYESEPDLLRNQKAALALSLLSTVSSIMGALMSELCRMLQANKTYGMNDFQTSGGRPGLVVYVIGEQEVEAFQKHMQAFEDEINNDE